MSNRHLSSVLGLLRLLKNTEGLGQGHSVADYLRQWAGQPVEEEAILRLSVYIQAQISGAEVLIKQSDFVEEGKVGLLQTVSGLRAAFSLGGMHTQIASHLPALDSSIAQFAILNSILGEGPDFAGSEELSNLIRDVDKLYQTVSEGDLDPSVKDTLVKHLHVLATLLRNLEVMGVEAAMAAYAELVIRLRTASAEASPETQAKVKKFWPKVEALAARIGALQKLYNAGVALANFGKPLLTLFKGE